MMNRWIIIFLFLTNVLLAQDNYVEELLHSNWEFNHEGEWLMAEVPGNNYSDLLNHNKISDPFIGTNEDSVQWVKHKKWTYKTIFIPSEKILRQEKQELVFEGLDTYADVYLNDKKILSANNQFRSWTVDVSSLLKKEKNELKIIFLPPIEVEKQKIKKQGYELPGGTRTMTRKAGFHYGWDWGATITTAGIWRDVKLVGWSKLKINDLYIEQKKINYKNYQQPNSKESYVELIAHFNYENNKKGFYEFVVYDSIRTKIQLEKGKGTISIPFEIIKFKLWRPIGQGESFMYDINCNIQLNNKKIFNQNKKVGIRIVEFITDKDENGKGFYFKINGQPLFMKGANYIPQDNLQNRVTPEKYRGLLQDVADANMNMIRVWGGGIYEEDIFYELCDSLGIMVWQDFMFACAMYPGDKEYLENVRQEAKENVFRLRQHPSIVLWCGNNENSEGWHRWGWQDAFSKREKKKIWKAYKEVFMDILPGIVSTHTNTSYWESSPQFGRGNPRHQFEGDAHYWGVWHDAEPFEIFAEKVPRFMSEFGFQSFPEMSTIRTFATEDDLSLESDVMNTHQKHPRGNKLINEYMARDYKVPTDFEDFVYVSQVLQAEGMGFGLEAHRRNQPYCMGTLYWQLNDCWPVASWSSRDYYGNWKALHYKAQDIFAPQIVSIEKDEKELKLYAIGDHPWGAFYDSCNIVLMDFDGNKIWDNRKREITIFNHRSQIFQRINLDKFKDVDSSRVVLVVELDKSKSRKLYYLEKDKNLNLDKENIEFNIQKIEEGFQVELFSKQLMKDVYLSGFKGKYSDNYFTLLPNEKKIIIIKTEESNADLLQIKTMNKIHEKY